MKISTLFEDRIGCVLAEETYEGLVVPAPTNERMHVISRVVAVGSKTKYLKVGDIAMWQWNAMIGAHCRYDVGEDRLFVIYERDVVAKVSDTKIKLSTFQVIGDWRLVERVQEEAPSSLIVIPSAVAETVLQQSTHHRLVQIGKEDVDRPCCVGDTLLVERHRANPLRIEGKDYYYVQSASVLGVVS